MKDRILNILEEFGVERRAVTENVHFVKDLGFDSLDTVDLMMKLEQEFGLRIPDEDYHKLTTLSKLIQYLEEEQSVAMAA
ncbi:MULTISPECIES: acyl carrier protein [Runella]|uniref:Acyl carrier protein n=1 Tax=Runella defluvii TaxID=370973 RepID=A0A7W5ZQK4_9BACT|nr:MULTISPECIES: acyl carrier protein [Runella]MBB3840955.1 acyl carrier protein [Runella defluvii]MCA0231034.1 acyl carrier protein [Bacteroidota bacterium]HAK76528.1 acyl carrier protein [Runella sp.]HAO51212.1 acyl carrier protein [Runella sp.]